MTFHTSHADGNSTQTSGANTVIKLCNSAGGSGGGSGGGGGGSSSSSVDF